MERAFHIALDVRDIDQLFTSFDPSPFHAFSLNTTAAQYIFSQAWYAPRDAAFVIDLSVHGQQPSSGEVGKLQDVLRMHFTRLAASDHQNFRNLIRTGLISLAIGLFVLAICTMLSRAVDASSLPDGWREGIRDGISVFGWVANWRPAQILFYDWWPVRRSRNLHRRLARAEVRAATVGARTAAADEVAPLDTVPIAAAP